jgi:hypothetical protein
MKPPQISIVMLGRNAHLLESRKWALQSRGYRVHAVAHPAGLDEVPQTPPVALLVLCHTLSARERAETIARASARWKDVKKLLLMRDSSTTPSAVVGQVERTLDVPAGLLNKVTELVGQAGSSSYSHTY